MLTFLDSLTITRAPFFSAWFPSGSFDGSSGQVNTLLAVEKLLQT